MIAWRRAVQQYGCTRCGAPPGEPCHTDTNRTRYEPHADRTNLAKQDDWRIEEDDDDGPGGAWPRPQYDE